MIFLRNENSKNVFRQSGGFIWILSVLGGTANFGKSPPLNANSSKPINSDDIFKFLSSLLYTLSRALSNNSENQRYFRKDIQFSTLATSLLEYSYFIEGSRIVELCDSLLNTALRGMLKKKVRNSQTKILLFSTKTKELGLLLVQDIHNKN